MLEVSRRNFLKATALSAVCLSGLNASFLEFSQAKQVKYFIKDSEIPHQGNFINAEFTHNLKKLLKIKHSLEV